MTNEVGLVLESDSELGEGQTPIDGVKCLETERR